MQHDARSIHATEQQEKVMRHDARSIHVGYDEKFMNKLMKELHAEPHHLELNLTKFCYINDGLMEFYTFILFRSVMSKKVILLTLCDVLILKRKF